MDEEEEVAVVLTLMHRNHTKSDSKEKLMDLLSNQYNAVLTGYFAAHQTEAPAQALGVLFANFSQERNWGNCRLCMTAMLNLFKTEQIGLYPELTYTYSLVKYYELLDRVTALQEYFDDNTKAMIRKGIDIFADVPKLVGFYSNSASTRLTDIESYVFLLATIQALFASYYRYLNSGQFDADVVDKFTELRDIYAPKTWIAKPWVFQTDIYWWTEIFKQHPLELQALIPDLKQ